MSAPTFPGTRVPVTEQMASALESLTSHVAAGGNPAQWVRDNIALGGRCVQTSTGAVTVCPTCGLVLMGDECDSCEGRV